MTECYFFLKWIFPQLIHQVDTGWYALFVERFGSFQEKTFSFYNLSFPLFPRFTKEMKRPLTRLQRIPLTRSFLNTRVKYRNEY